ncbi:methyltransferase domain-containing protein [Halorubrum sp. Atlit-26R]|nr:methyltransferase domain-containing protein [Halorubrum sp. Atlit-26R]
MLRSQLILHSVRTLKQMLKIEAEGRSITIDPLPGAMDPSPYTEFLIERIVARDSVPREVVDVGCGSGALSIFLAKLGVKQVYAFDINDAALEATRKNTRINDVSDRVDVRKVDFTESLDSELDVDMVVSNPPSLPMRSKPDSEYDMYNYYGGEDGRKFIEKLIDNSPTVLKRGGRLLFIHTSLANVGDTVEQLPSSGFDSFDCSVSELPFRNSYYEHIDWFRELKERGVAHYEEPDDGGRETEYLYALSCEFSG